MSALCDPVTLEIIRGAIRAAQAEMEALLERTAISAFIREKKDFYTALFDADGVMAVGSNVPIFGDICGPVFQHFPIGAIRQGDLFWYSDCYGSNGAVSHSNDQVFLAPVFHAGRRCAFVMGWAHFSDVGGSRPGSISPDATDIFQEGIIPPTRLIDAGRTNEAALAIFYRNSRQPEACRGDARPAGLDGRGAPERRRDPARRASRAGWRGGTIDARRRTMTGVSDQVSGSRLMADCARFAQYQKLSGTAPEVASLANVALNQHLCRG